MTAVHRAFIIGLLTGAAIMWIGQARAHGPAEWIRANPEMSWRCSEKDCFPGDGKVSYGEDGYYHVEGLEGRKKEGDIGFYRYPHVDRPWFCAIPGTGRLRCLILPEGQG